MNFCKTFFSLFLLSALLVSCSPNKGKIYPSIVLETLIKNRLDVPKTEGEPNLKITFLSNEEAKERFNTDYSNYPPLIGCLVLEDENFPVGQEFELITIQGRHVYSNGAYVVNEKQKLVSKRNPTFPLSQFVMCLGDAFCPGEELGYGVISTDGKICEVLIYTPLPIQTSWEDGATASISYSAREKNFFYLRLKNFKPNEIFKFTSISEHEKSSYSLKVFRDGNHISLIAPGDIGFPCGNSKIIIERTGFEPRTLEYTYGNP